MLFFTMGTALCAPIAKDFSIFFFGRAIQGIGGGGIITMGQVIFADIIPLRQRPKYFSIVLAAWALGSVLGPLIGGLFVQHVIWEWCFYINVGRSFYHRHIELLTFLFQQFPFCILGLVLVPIYVKLKTKKTSLMAKLARVDWVGSFLFTAGMTSFLIGISWAGIQFEWNSPQVIAPIVVGVFGIVTTFVWEVYFAAEPILRLSLFYCWSAVLAYACALFQGLIVCLQPPRIRPYLALTAADLLHSVLCAILLLCRSLRDSDASWLRCISGHGLFTAWIHRRIHHHISDWSVSMGYLGRLGGVSNCLRPVPVV